MGERAVRRRHGARVVSSFIDSITVVEAVRQIVVWATEHASRYICACNVHSLITAWRDPRTSDALANADLNLPDGAPVAWVLRRKRFHQQRRVSGPDLVLAVCKEAARAGTRIYLYGSTVMALDRLRRRLLSEYPLLQIVGTDSPPFRALTADEDAAAVERIKASGAQIVLVGLGCPKQEIWMAAHKNVVDAVMIGVGAAFDFHAGLLSRAPHFMRAIGLEWLHRLLLEPRRLWRRYLVTNTLFVLLMARELISATEEEPIEVEP